MGKWVKQAEAASQIRELLFQRGVDVPSNRLKLADSQIWVVFERNQKQIGVDCAAGVWIREQEGEWRCLAMPCNLSGAVQAVEFLTKAE